MPRFVWILISFAVIIGALFGVMLAAYVLGGFAEAYLHAYTGVSGGSSLVNILVLMLAVVMIMATLLTLAERKWSAFMQDRMGPNRARINLPGLRNTALGGLPHILTDVLKMLTKEAFRPKNANKFLFNLAPMLAFAPVFALFAIVPADPTIVFDTVVKSTQYSSKIIMSAANPDFGLLYLFAIASLAVYGTSLAGWSSNNKFALLGGVRAASQMISYEVALGLSLVGMMMAFNTVQLAGDTGMSAMQSHYLWSVNLNGFDFGIPQWGFLLQPVGFVLFFAAAFAETKRAPFDAPEGESEIVGYFLEYSGMQFGMFMIAEFVEVVVLSGVLVAVFFGGWSLPFGQTWLEGNSFMQAHQYLYGAIYGTVFWVKVIFLIYLQLVIRWTFPRFRYDQIQTLGWKILLPAGLVNLFVTGALILLDPSLKYLALFGALEILAVAAVTLTSPRQVRKEEEQHALGDHGHGAPAPTLTANTH